jgi:cytochrome c-type biogenesis protein CcmE
LRRLRRRLVVLVLVYFFAGAASQKLVPGVDEIIPFYGWSLFSKVPNEDSRYTLLIHRHKGRDLEPPVSFLHAPDTIVSGNRYIGRKVIQRLGGAVERGEADRVEDLRRLLEQSYLRGRVRYELIFERYDPLQKWRTGANLEERSLGQLTSGEGG